MFFKLFQAVTPSAISKISNYLRTDKLQIMICWIFRKISKFKSYCVTDVTIINQAKNIMQISNNNNFKVTFRRKARGLRPKIHMILIELKIEAHYLKKNSQTSQEKNRENLNWSNTIYDFWANNLVLFSWTGLYQTQVP